MSVMISDDKKELIITCNCGCDEACHIKIDDWGGDTFAYMTYLNSDFYKEQEHSGRVKAKRIWNILRGKDYCYAEIVFKREDWETFKDWVNQQQIY